MEQNLDILNKFQAVLLERTTLNKILPIYNKNAEDTVVECVDRQYSCKDVLLNVTKQLDALQTADGTMKLKLESNLIKNKKYKLMPVNLLPLDDNIHPECSHYNTNKFETQCVSDTQLINIVEDAEKVVPPKGMTQEFEISFHDQHIVIEKETVTTKTNNLDMSINSENVATHLGSLSPSSLGFTQTNLCNKNLNEEIIYESYITVQEQRDNELISLAESDEIQSKITKSPVINYIKPLSLKNSLPPLIYNLDEFENFETLAFPIVERNPNLDAAKHLINSQIIDKELCLGHPRESLFNKERSPSPILCTRQKRYSANSHKLGTDKIKNVSLKVPDKISQPIDMHISKYFEDEVLFSSDEEDIKEGSHQDLPLTCALETSFYNQDNVLEKTMYVGFQTASNKSIQINTESFSKAQSVLKDLHEEDFKLTFTELVAMYDNKNSNLISNLSCTKNELEVSTSNDQLKLFPCNKDEEISTKTEEVRLKEAKTNEGATMTSKDLHINEMDSEVKIKEDLNKENNNNFSDNSRILHNYPINENYEPIFHTASNKRIKLSENALAKCQLVFKDIDLEDKCDDTMPEEKEINRQVKNLSSICDKRENERNNPKEISEHIQLDDHNIIQEFENDLIDFDMYQNFEKDKDIGDPSKVNMAKSNSKDVVETKVESTKHSDRQYAKAEVHFSDGFHIDTESTHLLPSNSKTANDKPVTISSEDLSKNKISFNYTETSVSTKPIIPGNELMKTEFCGFITANNKPITVSNTTIAKSKNIFKDILTSGDEGNQFFSIGKANDNLFNDFKEGSKNDFNVCNKISLPADDMKNKASHEINLQTFNGFRTASNKNVKISSEALARSKMVFHDLELYKEDELCDMLNLPVKDIEGFPTTNNKEEASSRSLAEMYLEDCNEKYLKIQRTASNKPSLNKIEKPVTRHENIHSESESSQKHTFVGFQTANNKQVKVSDQALALSKKILQDLEFKDITRTNDGKKPPFDEIEKPVTHYENINSKLESSPKHSFVGFQTASNKQVKVSDQALALSKKILQDLELPDINRTNDERKPPFNEIKKPVTRHEDINSKLETSQKHTFVGFQTASNKQVKVSDQALALSKKILQDLELADINRTNDEMKLPFNQTKKPVTRHEDINSKLESFQKHTFVGFQTASNKQVKVSDQALALSKKILQDLELEDINRTNDGKKPHFNQIEKVITSKENIGSELKSSQNQAFVGFQTASNKQVKVSDQAMALSKKMLHDLEFEEINKTNYKKIVKEKPIMSSLKEVNDCRNGSKQTTNYNLLFRTGNNEDVKVTQEALIESKKILHTNRSDGVIKTLQTLPKRMEIDREDKTNAVETLFDSQVLNNFEVTMYTEDFCKDVKPDRSKRSGSPILLCSRAKKRKKFEVPCKKTGIPNNIRQKTHKTISEQRTTTVFSFDKNYKKNKKYTLKDLKKMEELNNNENVVDPYILNINYDTALHFEFTKERNDFSDIRWTTEDLKKYFISQVNHKLIPDGWLDNHLKLIIFKLISYERQFKNTMSGICSVKNVLNQLKYRYDRELYNVERPVIRKLLEKDDVSTKTMILRVIEIYADGTRMTSETSSSNIELLLSDGWYSIKACLDQMLVKLVQEKKIIVGTKLAIHGAEMVNCDQGMAPWEDTSRVRLKLFGNSTRRALLDARLGHHPSGGIPTRLSRVRLEGGKVSRMRAFVTRVYPTVYVEKFDDGSTVTRSERLEHLFQIKYESDRQALLEKIYEEMEKEFIHQESQDSECDTQCRGGLDNGSQINRLMRLSKDPAEFRAKLTNSQCRLLQDYSSNRREKLLQTVQTRIEERLKSKGLHIGRNVVTVMKVRLADVDPNGDVSKAMMSIWRPNDAVQEIIKEGMWIDMYNVVPTAIRFSEIQFSAGRQTIFSRSKYRESDKIKHIISRLKRTCYSIKDLVQNPAMSTDCNEVDTAGLIFLIDPSISQFESIKGQLFQNVYIADREKNIVCVNFWGGLKKFGYENVLDTGQVLACINLQKRAGNTRKSIPQFRATEFSYFTKTPKIDNLRKAVDDLNKSLSGVNIKKFCEECVSKKNSFSILKYGNGENISPYRINYSDYNISRHKSYIHSPKTNNLDDILNLSGLDFESTFKQTDTQDMSPSAISRKKKVNEKIARLKMYGEPPPITPINIINKSNNATSAFKNPLYTNNNSYVKEKDQQSCSTHHNPSPICSKSNTRRHCGNPVKLNFSNNISKQDCNVSKTIDPFAEEFDASPPLSLD